MNQNSLYSIRLKIVMGYCLLITIFLFVLFRIYKENNNLIELDKETIEVAEQRRQTEQIVIRLLDLSFQGEQLVGWREKDVEEYRCKRDSVVNLLKALQLRLNALQQCARIDSVLYLLKAKEEHLLAILQDIRELREGYDVVQNRIPDVINKTKSQSADLSERLQENLEKGHKQTTGIRGLFRNKKKSREQTELENETILRNVQRRQAGTLRLLADEIVQTHTTKTMRLLSHVDSLTVRNAYLNQQISRLLTEFGIADRSIREKIIERELFGRKRAVLTVSALSVLAFLLAITFYILLHRDIQERHRNRVRLEKSNKRNEELLAARKNMMLTISHDLRAPLAAISGYAELLPDERNKENRRRYSDAILQSCERMLCLLNTLLGFYRLETGKEQPENKPFRLKPLADILTDEYAPLAAKKQLEFTTEYSGGDIVVVGDRERILGIVSNLLSNAIKFTAQGIVRLNMRHTSEELTVTVEDTGIGMTEAETDAIFQPFERLDKSEEPGFGLGLSITLALVGLLNGTLEVTSSPGKGSRFIVHLPLPLCNDAGDALQTVTPTLSTRHLQVAVVDNDAVLLAMTVGMFNKDNIYADGFRSARELMERMRTHRYDLILTDIVMPEMSGYGLLELLRCSNLQTAKTVPVVAMTARAERSEEDFVRTGFAGCLFKPFSRAELAKVVARCTAEQATVQAPVADFSMLLTDEQDKREMFALLLRETQKHMDALAAASEHCDTEAFAAVLHHLSPLWEALRIDGVLLELRDVLSSPDLSDDTLRNIANKVADTGKRLIEHVEASMKEDGDA